MIPEECMALLTYTNQIDPRVQLNEPTFDAWWMALEHKSFDQAKWCVKSYYATANPNSVGGVAALSPATLRQRISGMREQTDARQRALEPPAVIKNPASFRGTDPERWDRLVVQGRDEHRAKMRAKGITPHAETCPTCLAKSKSTPNG